MKWGVYVTTAFLNLQRQLKDVDSHRYKIVASL